MGEALWDAARRKENWWCSANFAYHVSIRFRQPVVSAIGDDKLGNEILENFDGKKLII